MNIENHEFMPWPKMARLSREVIITEKLDGTNACVNIVPTLEAAHFGRSALATVQGDTQVADSVTIFAGSRTRWIQPGNDNYGFAGWVRDNATELAKLGLGRHFGEWWGAGIQRRYGLTEKRFSLFNAGRWYQYPSGPGVFELVVDPITNATSSRRGPSCVSVVPVLFRGEFNTYEVAVTLEGLRQNGSAAAPGFRDPEGVIVYHTAAKVCFKKTFDDSTKSLVDNSPTPCDIGV